MSADLKRKDSSWARVILSVFNTDIPQKLSLAGREHIHIKGYRLGKKMSDTQSSV
jgi:hypothetical protein